MITTRVVGDVFVIVDPDGDLETTVGGQTTLDFVAIYTLLRGTFGDHYDFLSCYLDTGSGVVNLGSASGSIYQDATGIGRWTFNFRPDWGTTKLQHYSHYSFFSLNTLLHETGHRWLATVNYADAPGGMAQHLLHEDWIWTPGQKAVHWGRWLDNQNSCMDYDQAEWIDNGDGTFNRIDRNPVDPIQEEWFGYSLLDQYLMGLLPAAQVPDLKVVRNPSPAPSEGGPYGVPTGPYTPNPSALTVTIAQVQSTRSDEPAPFSGPRHPDHLNSQRVFHEAVVVVTKNSSPTSTFITTSDTWRRRHTAKFRRATAGRAMVDTSLLRSNYADLYVKDNPADTGAPGSSSPFWESPDLWVRNSDDGESLGGEVHQAPIRAQSNWVYVRVRNKGAQAYENVTVNFYLANFLNHYLPGTEFWYPVDWNPEGLLGSATLASIPPASGGVEGTAIAKVEWTADEIPPAAGWHPCLLCEVIPMEVMPTGLHHVFENRKLAQRNLTIIDPSTMPPGSGGETPGGGGTPGGDDGPTGYIFSFPFIVGHDLGRAPGITDLRIRAEQHREEIRLFLDPQGLLDGLFEEAEVIDETLPPGLREMLGIDEGFRWIVDDENGEPPPDAAAIDQSHPKASHLVGPTLYIDKNTELGVLPAGDPQPEAPLRIRFHDPVRIQLGYQRQGKLEARYRLRGLKPVVLNGVGLLELKGVEDAGLRLPLRPHQSRMLRLIGVVSPYGGGHESILYRISEEVGERVVGGVSVQIFT